MTTIIFLSIALASCIVAMRSESKENKIREIPVRINGKLDSYIYR